MSTSVFGTVLAGGSSQRMGRDKASIAIDGSTMLERVVNAGTTAGLSMLVVGRARPLAFPFPTTRFVTDQHPGGGPLGGLLTAFSHVDGDLLALACDLPLLNRAAVEWLLATAAPLDPARDVVVMADGRLQPLFAVWRRIGRTRLARAFAAGERSLMRCLATADPFVVHLPAQFAHAADDCDTPEDLARLRLAG